MAGGSKLHEIWMMPKPSNKYQVPSIKETEKCVFWIALANDESTCLCYIGSFEAGMPADANWWENPPQYCIDNPAEMLPNRYDLPRLDWRTW